MITNLNENKLLPNHHPYRGAPWYHDGAENVNIINMPFDVVDWVLVEAVKGNPDGSEPLESVETRAGLLTKDGWIVDLDGVSPLGFYDLSLYDQHYFIIRHRSHIDIMTSIAFTPSHSANQEHNFTNSPNKAYGPSQQEDLGNNVYGLIAGDYDGNSVINNMDFNHWALQSALVNKYVAWDGDGNTVVNALDYNLWTNNSSKIGIVHVWY